MSDKRKYRSNITGKVQDMTAAVAAVFPSFTLIESQTEDTFTPAGAAPVLPAEDESAPEGDAHPDAPEFDGFDFTQDNLAG